MNRERNITIVNIILLLMVIGLGVLQYIKTNGKPKYSHTIVISFCDERQPIMVKYFTNNSEPITSEDIESYHQAVPIWNKYVNVCNLETIQIKEHE